jgi:hypothetical protein
MRRWRNDNAPLRVAIKKLPEVEERPKLGLGRGKTPYSRYDVSVNGDSFVLVKCQQQVEELARLLELEVFHVPLPSMQRSPRGLQASSAVDDYLVAVAEMAGQLSENKALRTFLSTNVAPADNSKFWESDFRKRGWLSKKKGERAKLQRRFCVLKFGTLYYFKNEGDLNPLGSIRLDLVEVHAYREGASVGFTLQGGRKQNPRTFVAESQAECERWLAQVRAAKAEDKLGAVQGVLNAAVSEGRNLNAQNVSVQIVAESQQCSTNVASKCGGNPTWAMHPASFQVTSHRKFVYFILWDQGGALGAAPSCLGEISIPIGELAVVKKGQLDAWVPVCPQRFLQAASGELHVHIEYAFVPDEKTLEEQQRLLQLSYDVAHVALDWLGQHAESGRHEGIFRVPGRLVAMQAMWETALRSGAGPACLGEEPTVDDVGGLLKMCLRNVPEPLFPFATFDAVCALNPDDKGFAAAVEQQLAAHCSAEARALLARLLAYLKSVARLEVFNKMSAANLAVVFGPALLRQEEDSLELLYYLPKINGVVKKLIDLQQ